MANDKLKFESTPQGIKIKVKVSAGASRDRILGVWNGALKVSLSAPAEKGKANQALIKLLAGLLGVSRTSISIQQGHTSTHKILLINNLSNIKISQLFHC